MFDRFWTWFWESLDEYTDLLNENPLFAVYGDDPLTFESEEIF